MNYFIYLMLIIGCILSTMIGCSKPSGEYTNIGAGISKFKDGKVTCYTYYAKGISCLVTNED